MFIPWTLEGVDLGDDVIEGGPLGFPPVCRLVSFGKAKSGAVAPPCLHVSLVPKWDDPNDMGRDDKASGFTCEGCKQFFTREAGLALRASGAERLRHLRARKD